jgi:hypothetical protein
MPFTFVRAAISSEHEQAGHADLVFAGRESPAVHQVVLARALPAASDGEAAQRGVEQLVARRAHNPEVAGSSPAPATSPESVAHSPAVHRGVGEQRWGDTSPRSERHARHLREVVTAGRGRPFFSTRSAAPAPEQGGRGSGAWVPAHRAAAVAPQHIGYAHRGGLLSMRGSRRLLLGVAQSEELLTSKRRVAGSSPAAETINARSSTEERARPKGKAAGSIPAERTIFGQPVAVSVDGESQSRRVGRGGGLVASSHTRALRRSPSSPFPAIDSGRCKPGRAHFSLRRSA